jgi:NADPH-dependent curcumin reductase CurA
MTSRNRAEVLTGADMQHPAPETFDPAGGRTRRFVLAERPSGQLDDTTFRLESSPREDLRPGQARIVPLYLSLDPAMRGWLDDRPSYVPPVPIGGVMRARGVGRVVESRSGEPLLAPGQLVMGELGWRDELVVDGPQSLRAVAAGSDEEIRAELNLVGLVGLTAWVGVGIAKPQPGETCVVTAAAGAVGSLAGQIARLRGARVVGIAGGPDKCAVLTEQLGFHAAVDYKAPDWRSRLREATPDGVDALFENVGGAVLEAVIDRMNDHARIALCGLVATYNDLDAHTGPANFRQFVTKRIRAEGFIVLDHAAEFGPARHELRAWLSAGELTTLETVVDGFENLPAALAGLFSGRNLGKLMVRVGA